MKTICKKSLSVILAVLMMASTLVTGTVAFAAKSPIWFTPYSVGTTATFQRNADQYYSGYYSFTPEKTGTYAVYVQSPASNNGYISIYKKYDAGSASLKDGVASVNAKQTLYNENGTDIVLDRGYQTFELLGGETYFVEADAWSSDSSAPSVSFSVSPVDFSAWISYEFNSNGTLSEVGYDVTYTGSGTDVVVPASINYLPVIGVNGTTNKNITSLNLAYAASVESVDGFSSCKKLAFVTLNNGLVRIGTSAFANCKSLGSVVIPATVATVGGGAFYGCTALSNVVIANGAVKSIGENAFYNTALKTVVIPASVAYIGESAFGYERNFDAATVDPYDTTETPVAGFVIGGYAGTEAWTYAARNGIAFCDLNNCSHAYTVVSSKPATFFSYGKEVKKCAVCGAVKSVKIAKKKISVKSVKSSKKAQIVVKAAKHSGITGFQIQYSTSKKFTKKTTKSVKVKTKKALSKTIKSLKSGKKYYVRVRAYKVSGKKTVYGVYGAAKSVKVK